MFLTKGVGVHRHALAAFEFALRDADIEQAGLCLSSWPGLTRPSSRDGC
jgi:pyruvoyl-dependent arginine decarboxylase (PvlArgDC)